MSQPKQPQFDDEYDAIEAAVMETERGRWFLREFARRTRANETAALLAAIDRLENAMKAGLQPLPAAEEIAAAVHGGGRPVPGMRTEDLEGNSFESKILYFS
jgi:hypothetical protein